MARCLQAWAVGRLTTGEANGGELGEEALAACLGEALETQRFEAAVPAPPPEATG